MKKHRQVERAECLQGRRLVQQRVGPALHIGHRGGDGGLALFRGLLPGPGTHPVVNEVLGRCVQVTRLKREPGVCDDFTDGIRLIGWRRFGVEQGK